MKKYAAVISTFQFIDFASTTGGLRNWNTAPLLLEKKSLGIFPDPDFIGTKPKEVANPVTGENYMQ